MRGPAIHVKLAAVALAILTSAACAGRQPRPSGPTRPGTFIATAYCTSGRTAAGTRVRDGVVAADPGVLPLGTVIRVAGLDRPYNGVYRVLDTGHDIRGRRIDLYIRDCGEAVRFGRQPALVSVVRRAPSKR